MHYVNVSYNVIVHAHVIMYMTYYVIFLCYIMYINIILYYVTCIYVICYACMLHVVHALKNSWWGDMRVV